MKKKWIFLQGCALLTAIAVCAISLAGCEVASEPDPIAVENVTLDMGSVTLEIAGRRQLTATVTPDNADDKTVTWSSSNGDVATVSGGFVVAQGVGTATITAQAGGKSATCTVTVRPQPVPVDYINLDKQYLTLGLGEKGKIVATVFPDEADDKTVTWSSESPSVATVDSDGTVTAIAEGQAYIYARASNGAGAYCNVIVKGKEEEGHIAVESVTLGTDTLTIEPGDTRALTATVFPDNASDKTVTWTSSDETVATVDEYGTVTAVAPGIATITAKAGDMTATCSVTVKKILIPVESITINKHELIITYGETGKLTATVFPGNADDKTVAWSSDDPSIATVDSDGNVTAIDVGNTRICAQAGNEMAYCQVYVYPIITLDTETLTITPSWRRSLRATVIPENAADTVSIDWSSSDPAIADVSSSSSLDNISSTVSGIAPGTATITAKTWYGATATCEVTVISIDSVTLDKNTLTLPRGETLTLTATTEPHNVNDIWWGTSDILVVEIDHKDGNSATISARKVGTATITAWAMEGKEAKCEVTVIPPPAESVTLNATTLTVARWLGPGMAKKNLTATVMPDDADDTVTWSSSNEEVATVDNNGWITGLKAGTATITARAGDKTAECDIIVCDKHTYIEGKCTVCGTNPYLKDGTIDEKGRLTKYSGNEATVDIPDGVTYIGYNAFNGCTSLASVTIPGSVTSIEYKAFYKCTNLTSVTIPDGVTSIGGNAFTDCTSLTSIEIPDGVRL